MNKKEIVKTQNLTIDYSSLTVVINSTKEEIKISLNEANLLFLLYSNPNKIYTKDEIYTQCWEDGSVANSVVTQTISLLRKKFLTHNISIIDTIKNKGYKSGDRLLVKPIKRFYFLLFSVFILVSLFLIFPIFKQVAPNSITQNLNKVSDNIYMLSTSKPIDITKLNIQPNYLYFLHLGEDKLSISQCLFIEHKCNDVTNKIIFLETTENNVETLINQNLANELKQDNHPIIQNDTDQDGNFNLHTNVQFTSNNDKDYIAFATYNFYFNFQEDKSYDLDMSINISESGYNGKYTYFSDFKAKFDKDTLISNVINEDEQSSLIQHGHIEDQTKLKMFPKTFKNDNKYNYLHFYIIDKGFSLTYSEQQDISFIVKEFY
ncbi:winged helix-turn-helix domain-containing protein [Aliivibrio fischeri]|uniref:winged helix-turn-helix domain-containing protein n=1 Tax=Aliivibrio fischeri TaxID=668 RepID=UPI0009080B2E|nr:winged helix-turn-helix domain-containing protein [Aliivibrio fischeri]